MLSMNEKILEGNLTKHRRKQKSIEELRRIKKIREEKRTDKKSMKKNEDFN